jgi:hypothetical protein
MDVAVDGGGGGDAGGGHECTQLDTSIGIDAAAAQPVVS